MIIYYYTEFYRDRREIPHKTIYVYKQNEQESYWPHI